MTLEDFEKFVEKDGIEWAEDNDHFYFRDRNLAWYAKDAKNALRIGKERMKELSIMDLESELSRGLKVEHITRVTGYFAKVNSWNPGKKGELQDRHRAEVIFFDGLVKSPPVPLGAGLRALNLELFTRSSFFGN